MNTFLDNTAKSLYKRYGGDISSFKLILPNVRSRLFFQDSLSKVIDKPVWQPEYLSVDDLMSTVADTRLADRVRAVVELYKVYSRHHKESFDSFYFWGEMLLNDFDQTDKYMIDADMLFANLRDLKNMGNDLSYMTEEQLRIISRFWDSFGEPSDYSEHQKRFLTIWNTLGSVYHEFRERLRQAGVAYQGMAYRDAAEIIKSGEGGLETGAKYAVIGFNALSVSEKILFDHLRTVHEADFFWDTDDYYIRDKNQEAGLFVRENVKRYLQPSFFVNPTDNFSRTKDIRAISTASDSLQCKYAAQFIKRVIERDGVADKRTAIVLTDESLLVPLLYSLPEEVDNVNVTMGYPLRQTLAYSFVERFLKLQEHARDRKGEYAFYHSDVTGLLRHPFLLGADRENADRISSETVLKSRVYVKESNFAVGGLIETVFRKHDSWQQVGQYIIEILSMIDFSAIGSYGNTDTDGEKRATRENILQREYFGSIAECVRKLTNSLEGCEIEITVGVFSSLLKRMLQSLRIPFTGEPLKGVQIMGILETRNLDFDNVMILSMNDDNFPGNPSAASSFIPYNLRVAYGLPTPQHHEGVYGYYFYRLLQRATNVDMVYCSKNDEKSSGEKSRYIYQLEYETYHRIEHISANVDVNLSAPEKIVVEKNEKVMSGLERFLEPDDNSYAEDESENRRPNSRSLSPTAFYAYIECPLKFYFRSVAGIKVDDEISEEIDTPMFGTILHSAMEQLYTPLKNIYEPSAHIEALIDSRAVTDAVNRAIIKEYFKDDDPENGDDSDFEGEVLMIRDIVCQYINNNILPYDAQLRRYSIMELEKELSTAIPVMINGEVKRVRFYGKADRVESLDNGIIRIVDYKTGTPNLEFESIEQLFGDEPKKRNSAAMQTMLYSKMVSDMQRQGIISGTDVSPALYYVRNMNMENYSPQLKFKKGEPVERFSDCESEFVNLLSEKLIELFDKNGVFYQCDNINICKFCDYVYICDRV